LPPVARVIAALAPDYSRSVRFGVVDAVAEREGSALGDVQQRHAEHGI